MTDPVPFPTAVGDLDRKTYIGGGDVAAILGLSPWENSTPLATYMKKVGLLDASKAFEDPHKQKILWRGKAMEPVIIKMLARENPIKITKVSTEEAPNRYLDGEYGFMAAEIDFEWEVTEEMVLHLEAEYGIVVPPELIGTTQNGEMKSHHPFAVMGNRTREAKYGEQGTDEIPIEYGCQAWHGQGITGRQATLFAVLVGTDDLRIYWVKRDEGDILAIREAVKKFWFEHVEAGVPPKPIRLPDVWIALRQRPASVAIANPEILGILEEYKKAKEDERVAKENVDELKFILGSYMVGHAENKKPTAKTEGKHILRLVSKDDAGVEFTLDVLDVTLQSQVRTDDEKLRKEYPEVAAACTKEIDFYVVRIPKRKGA